jgi:hypothetical protein
MAKADYDFLTVIGAADPAAVLTCDLKELLVGYKPRAFFLSVAHELVNQRIIQRSNNEFLVVAELALMKNNAARVALAIFANDMVDRCMDGGCEVFELSKAILSHEGCSNWFKANEAFRTLTDSAQNKAFGAHPWMCSIAY